VPLERTISDIAPYGEFPVLPGGDRDGKEKSVRAWKFHRLIRRRSEGLRKKLWFVPELPEIPLWPRLQTGENHAERKASDWRFSLSGTRISTWTASQARLFESAAVRERQNPGRLPQHSAVFLETRNLEDECRKRTVFAKNLLFTCINGVLPPFDCTPRFGIEKRHPALPRFSLKNMHPCSAAAGSRSRTRSANGFTLVSYPCAGNIREAEKFRAPNGGRGRRTSRPSTILLLENTENHRGLFRSPALQVLRNDRLPVRSGEGKRAFGKAFPPRRAWP